MISVETPAGWSGQGSIPDPATDGAGALWEDLVQLKSPSGVTLDVGWYPQGNPEGQFLCVVVVDRDWEFPLRKILTKDPQVVARWIQDEVVKADAVKKKGK